MNKKITKRPKTKISEVAGFLKLTGFVLEMEVADYLKSKGYSVKVNELFFDYENEKNREIDLIATKKVNEIELSLIIECKQSNDKDWVFICSDQRPPIYYQYVKYSPELPYEKRIDETGVFDNTHILSKNISIAQNAIITRKGTKNLNELSIRECLMKLPKALIDYAHKNSSKKERRIFVPLVVFSNQFFSASYDGDLKVKEHDFIQHSTIFDSPTYEDKAYSGSLDTSVVLSNIFLENKNTDSNIKVSKISRGLGKYYLIDFSTKEGLAKYIKEIEKGANSINLDNWEIEKKDEESEKPLAL